MYCNSGNNSKVHGLYLVKYPQQMETFVLDGYEKATGNSTGGSNTTTTTASPTTTAGATSSTSGSGGSATSGASATPTTAGNKNAAAGLSTGLKYAVPAALLAAAQMLL